MKNDSKKDFNLGGSLERGVSGDYELKVGEVFKEAWNHTIRNFLSFFPSILILLIIQFGVFYIALKLQLGELSEIVDFFQNPGVFDQRVIQAIFIANFSYEVVSAPIYAGISLMAMSHTAGLSTEQRHIAKGLQFTVPVILATLFSLILQGVAGMVLPFLSLYFSLAFSNAILLICEKRILPIQSLLLSLRAVNKKIIVIGSIYLLIMLMFIIAAVFYGVALIFVIPFFFHVKGIIYRNMFGVKLKIISNDDNDKNINFHVFDA
ncbi:hypothetical protein CF67_21025 [Candidatus Photodesmus blepharus]|uniref:Proline and glycine rich transmembrane protein gene in bax n=1 Tax=Candidatus Photodesmus blepharonis TaxID=1179155 RepID=A0A084CNF9_9GAMM|nr:hypothetical protein [Candidatus Photodesmus blepharus]KEY91338.1 hypothetical protein CF67_21025 [Candidatus Photodesmus blepharus]